MQARAAVQTFWMHASPCAQSLSARHCGGVLRTHCPLVHTAPIGQSLSTIHAPGLFGTHCPLGLHVEPAGQGAIGPHCGPVVALHWPLTHA